MLILIQDSLLSNKFRPAIKGSPNLTVVPDLQDTLLVEAASAAWLRIFDGDNEVFSGDRFVINQETI